VHVLYSPSDLCHYVQHDSGVVGDVSNKDQEIHVHQWHDKVAKAIALEEIMHIDDIWMPKALELAHLIIRSGNISHNLRGNRLVVYRIHATIDDRCLSRAQLIQAKETEHRERETCRQEEGNVSSAPSVFF
jgi:hypothetical protein